MGCGMSVLCLTPVSQPCGFPPPSPTVAGNPNVFYDVTLGTPTAQGLVPAFTNLPAVCVEINGNGPQYVWNPQNGKWN